MHMHRYLFSLNIKVKECDSAEAQLPNKMRNRHSHYIVSCDSDAKTKITVFGLKTAISNGFRLKNSANIV